jgi:hypothetical protein
MAPSPKAKLTFSFVPFFNPPAESHQPMRTTTETTLSADAEDTVHVEYTVINLTEVAALEGEMTLVICDGCKFAREPEMYRKLAGGPEQSRYRTFERILPHVHLATEKLDVVVPRQFSDFKLGISYRCRTCILDSVASTGLVHVTRAFVNPLITLPKPLVTLPSTTQKQNKKKQ